MKMLFLICILLQFAGIIINLHQGLILGFKLIQLFQLACISPLSNLLLILFSNSLKFLAFCNFVWRQMFFINLLLGLSNIEMSYCLFPCNKFVHSCWTQLQLYPIKFCWYLFVLLLLCFPYSTKRILFFLAVGDIGFWFWFWILWSHIIKDWFDCIINQWNRCSVSCSIKGCERLHLHLTVPCLFLWSISFIIHHI